MIAKARTERSNMPHPCPQCETVYINGVLCHEQGCPEAWKDYTRTCRECGCDFKPMDRFHWVCMDCIREMEAQDGIWRDDYAESDEGTA